MGAAERVTHNIYTLRESLQLKTLTIVDGQILALLTAPSSKPSVVCMSQKQVPGIMVGRGAVSLIQDSLLEERVLLPSCQVSRSPVKNILRGQLTACDPSPYSTKE